MKTGEGKPWSPLPLPNAPTSKAHVTANDYLPVETPSGGRCIALGAMD